MGSGEIIAAIAVILTVVGMGVATIRWIVRVSGLITNVQQTQTDIKDDLKLVNDGFEKRVDRLEIQARDFRPTALVAADIEHTKRNVLTVVEGVNTKADRHGLAIDALRDRMTVQETKHEATAIAVNEVKRELKDTRHEINDRFNEAEARERSHFEALSKQFDQVCNTIREMSDRKPKA